MCKDVGFEPLGLAIERLVDSLVEPKKRGEREPAPQVLGGDAQGGQVHRTARQKIPTDGSPATGRFGNARRAKG